MEVRELRVAPAVGAEPQDAEEGAERDDLAERPERHVVPVLAHDIAGIGIVLAAVELALQMGSLPVRDGCHVAAHDGVAVFAGVFGCGEQAHLGEVLQVERHGEQGVAQLAVEVRQDAEMPEVEADVLPVAVAADVAVEVAAVGVDAEELALGAQVGCGLCLGDEVEGYALRFHVGYLLVDVDHRLGVRLGCADVCVVVLDLGRLGFVVHWGLRSVTGPFYQRVGNPGMTGGLRPPFNVGAWAPACLRPRRQGRVARGREGGVLMARTYGYARVSTREQNLDRQMDALREFGVAREDIFADKASGKDFERPQWIAMKEALEQGDVLVVKSIDRFGRSYEEIIEQWRDITKVRGAAVVVLDMPLLDTRRERDGITGVLIGDIVLQLLSYVAQVERESIHQRQAEGIAAAKARGVKFGRPKKRRPGTYKSTRKAYLDGHITRSEAASRLKVSISTFDKWLREDRAKRASE